MSYSSDSDSTSSSSNSSLFDVSRDTESDSSSESDTETSEEEDSIPLRVTDSDTSDSSSTDSDSSSTGIPKSSEEFVAKPVTDLPALKDMASVCIAVALWKHADILRGVSGLSSIRALSQAISVQRSAPWKSLVQKIRQSAEKLPLPATLVENINQYVTKIDGEIHVWVKYHHRKVFLIDYVKCALVYCLFGDVIWYSNGTIDYKGTAKNLITSCKLSDVVKYRLLCLYCLEDEKISPLSLVNDITNNVDRRLHPIIHYWNCYHRNKLQKVHSKPYPSVDVFMFENQGVDNWPAKEYFFERLSPEEQVKSAIKLIDKYGVTFQRFLLTKLNESQRWHVYLASRTNRAVNMLVNYAKTGFNNEDVYSLWFDIRNLINRDQFVRIFKKLFNLGLRFIILQDIWNHADDDFKHYIFEYNNGEIIDKMLKTSAKRRCVRDVLFTMLSDSNEEMKNAVTKKNSFKMYCEELLKQQNFQELNQLLSLCFPVREEMARFKMDFVKESSIVWNKCLNFYSEGDLINLNGYLSSLLSPHSDLIIEYKKNLLMSSDGINQCVRLLLSIKDTLNDIINDVSPSDDFACELKKKILFSNSAIHVLKRKISKNRLDEVKETMDRYVLSNEDEKKLKKKLIDDDVQLLRQIILKSKHSQWQSLMLWYFEDEKMIKQNKRELPLNDLFNEILLECVFESYDKYQSALRRAGKIEFVKVEKFLTWYFESSNAVKKYKLQMLDSYKKIDVISKLLKDDNTSYLKSVMSWFFEKDIEQIGKFEKKHKGEKIIKTVQLARRSCRK
ncbi:uncharacterized protein LOC135843616 [Planococcus citri]|uniref:uncharacterized protein LOC135843616 n=1 Tax=Planococcus citri TaxID=170843 RepID=UPI0031FA406C